METMVMTEATDRFGRKYLNAKNNENGILDINLHINVR